MKLYRYRPISEFLFKELKYQELYHANYSELNDPLDMNTLLDFRVKDKNEIAGLTNYLIFLCSVNFMAKEDYVNSNILINLIKDREKINLLNSLIFDKIIKEQI